MDDNVTQGFGTLARALGLLALFGFLLAGLFTGVWLLLAVAVAIGIGMVWAGALKGGTASHR